MSLSSGVVKGIGGLAEFTGDTVLDTDAPTIKGLVNEMAGNSYGLDLNVGFNPAGPRNI